MKTLGIIPARYASSRLPGKPLADIHGKSMIQHVYRRAFTAVDDLLVATDDVRIQQEVERFGGKAIITSEAHSTGTNRCLEAYEIFANKHHEVDVIINIQGDEPMIEANEIRTLAQLFSQEETELATLVKQIETQAELDNTTGCFVVINKLDEALYFSRALIPVLRNYNRPEWLGKHRFYKHLGMYAYRPDALRAFAQMEQSPLELAESLEQNRWLENGRKIKVGFAQSESLSVDTPEDLEAVRKAMAEK